MMCRLTSLSQPSCFKRPGPHRDLHSFPTRRSSDLVTRVLDEHAAFAGVEAGMTCGASGQHAIHHVNAKRDVIGEDRKSTRLNSSHTVISYAVFCLKKKKHGTPATPPNPDAHHTQSVLFIRMMYDVPSHFTITTFLFQTTRPSP